MIGTIGSEAFFVVALEWLALGASAVSVFAVAQLIRNELRRLARRKLKAMLARRHTAHDNDIELLLAQVTAGAMRDRNVEQLQKLGTAEILQDYILDVDFRRRLYSQLLAEFRELRRKADKDTVDEVVQAVSSWRERPIEIEAMGLSGPAGSALRHLEWKDNYFEEKRNEMVSDISDAIRAAARSHEREIANAG